MLFHFAVASDTHTIDDYYEKGTENGVEDNESILRTTEHLVADVDQFATAEDREGFC
jgi:hypothetical protein